MLVPRDRQRAESGIRFLWRWRSRLARRATLLVLTAALGMLALAGVKQMLRPGTGAAGDAGPRRPCLGRRPPRLLGRLRRRHLRRAGLGVYHLQPAYNRQFALREPLRAAPISPSEGTCRSSAIRSAGIPSVSICRKPTCASTRRDQRRQLLADLRSRPRTLLLVKSGKTLDELLRDLPDSVEFAVCGRPGLVTAGWIRPRPKPIDGRYAAC